jgi:hypothetical protein
MSVLSLCMIPTVSRANRRIFAILREKSRSGDEFSFPFFVGHRFDQALSACFVGSEALRGWI